MQKSANILTIFIVLGLVLGVLIGQYALFDASISSEALSQKTQPWKTAGDLLLLRPLKLVAIPLIFTSVLVGVTSIGDPKKLGLLGGATLVFYVTTMILAVAVGVSLGAIVEPGAGVPQQEIEALVGSGEQVVLGQTAAGGLGEAWINILRLMVPDNFIASASAGQALSIITATILLGVGLLAIGEKGKVFIEVIESLHEALMRIVGWVLWLLPLGVLLLVAWAVGSMGLNTVFVLLKSYFFTVIAGLGIHMLITLPIILALLTRVNPYKYMWSIRSALFTAFGTSSSMATLPVTIETTTEFGGCSRRASGLVLPLGATVNMDGTALYQGVAVMFMFQAFGHDLGFAQYLVIVLTATLAAVGAAGVPGGSLVTTLIIIQAVNSTLQGTGIEPLPLAAIGLILPVDRILDMSRTTVNVWGDSVGARIITRLAPDIEENREAAFG